MPECRKLLMRAIGERFMWLYVDVWQNLSLLINVLASSAVECGL